MRTAWKSSTETGNKIPETMLCFAPLGYRDVTGYRFVYAGTLTQGVAAEMCINNLRLLGLKPLAASSPADRHVDG